MLRSAIVFLIWPILMSSSASSWAVAFIVSNSVSLTPAPPLPNCDCLRLTSSEPLLRTTSAVSFIAALNAAMSLSSDNLLRSPFSLPSACL